MTYLLSDPHGEYDLFCRLMDKVKFSGSDRLICCGDMVDKGKHSIRLAKLLFSLGNAVLLSGNHEYEFLKFYWALMRNADDYDAVLTRLMGYFPDDGALLDWDTVDRFEALPYYYEEEHFLCVHAGAPLDGEGRILPLKDAEPGQLVYDRNFKDPELVPNTKKCVFFGHTPTVNLGLAPCIHPYLRTGARGDHISDYYKVHLDTGTYLTGVLGCFRLEDCEMFHVVAE